MLLATTILGRHGSRLLLAALVAITVISLAPASAASATSATSADNEKITLNLKNKDISALINTVAEITDRNFVVDPRVKAKVTVISKRPMDADELYKVFLSILQVHGFSAIPAGDITKIVPDVNAKQLGTEPRASQEAGDRIVTRVIKVQNVPVAQLVPILRPLIPQQGHFAAYPPTNVVIISDRAANVERLSHIIERIDQSSNDQMEVVHLEHASATEVARVLQTLQQGNAQGKGAGPGQVQIVADERTNSILMSGDKANRLRYRAMIAHLDTPLEDSSGDTHVVYLHYAKAEDIAKVLQGVSENIQAQQEQKGSKTPAASQGSKEDVSIQADEATNSLVISAPPKVQKELTSVIRKLDVRRAQVLIEAAVVEVSADTAAELGVQFAVDGSQSSTAGVGGTNFDAAGNGSLANIISSIQQGSTPNPGSGLSLAVGDLASGVRFGALLRALASNTDTNILSTPSLTTLDNQEAEIRVAENVPFVTGEYANTNASGGNTVNPFQTIQRKDVGLILKVTPQINEGDSVMLDLEQEVSSVSQSTQAVDLITNKRSIKTSVLVDDGKLVILGGLIDDQVFESAQKVPLLGDIPLLGHLFRYRTSESKKRNLMLFLRPHIIRTAETMSRYASQKYNYVRAAQLAKRESGVSLLPDSTAPVLPPLDRPAIPPPFDPVQ
ncbi:MAG TPA: type II secretion system secretin GspD [Gammaproteobacteria bacterium]|nr:type II secretion system secretin GspD [Gammaproteobacteria bacterium]